MKRLTFIAVFMAIIIPMGVNAAITNSSSLSDINVYIISDDECKDCDNLKEYLEGIENDYPRMFLSNIDKSEDKELVKKIKETLKIKKNNLPLTVIGTNYFIGYSKIIKEDIKDAIKIYSEYDNHCDLVSKLKNNEDINDCIKDNKDIYKQEDNKLLIIIPIIIITIIAILAIIYIHKNKKSNK